MTTLLRALLLASAAAACTHQVTPALVDDSEWVRQSGSAPSASSPAASEPAGAPAPAAQEPSVAKDATPAAQPTPARNAADPSREPGDSNGKTVPRTPAEIPGAMPAPEPLQSR